MKKLLTTILFLSVTGMAYAQIAVPFGGTGSTTLSGLLKGNGTGSVKTGVAGQDYQAPLSGGSLNDLTYWTSGTALSATGSPAVGYFTATSSTATSTIQGNLLIGNDPGLFEPSGLFPTDSTPQLGVSNNGNDLLTNITIRNQNPGAYSAGCLTFVNDSPLTGGVTASDYGSDCFSGTHFNSNNAPGGGLFAGSLIPGLPNSLVRVSSDGFLLFGSLSSNTASSGIVFALGPGYSTGNYDTVLLPLSSTTNLSNAGLGIGSTTPDARLSLTSSTTNTFPFIDINTMTNGVNNKSVFNIQNSGKVGISTSSPATSSFLKRSLPSSPPTRTGRPRSPARKSYA